MSVKFSHFVVFDCAVTDAEKYRHRSNQGALSLGKIDSHGQPDEGSRKAAIQPGMFTTCRSVVLPDNLPSF